MAVRDIEALIRERGLHYDPNMDVSPGSPFDVQVVQPVKRRLGTDPFTVDLSTFIADRMLQAFPDIANQEEDAVTDLLNKPATLLWDPIVRENIRVRQNLSFKDPSQMTLEEAESLGANFFTERRRGNLSRGAGRILFPSAQSVSVSPANFFTSRAGLHFFPTETQSIRPEELILNITADGLYYFDVNVIAEAPGVEYNIGPDELVKVANMPGATRVTNTRKFRSGVSEENTQAYISRIKQELTERSLVTLRGAAAKLVGGFPEINRLNVIGFNDPEMQRDVLKGGGLGGIQAGGREGLVVADGEGKTLQRRFYTAEADFQALLGSSDVTGYILTVFGAFGPATLVQDLTVSRLVGPNELDVAEQVLVLGAVDLRWTLRKRELTLSGIPGGILFPNTANGELVVRDDEVHVGGMFDTYVRGAGFEEETLALTNITDDAPLLSGLTATVVDASGTNVVQLNSLVENVDFVAGDSTTQALDAAVRFGYSLQLQDPPEAGNYRILAWGIAGGGQVQLTVDPEPSAPTLLNSRWRLFDVINIDLLNPRETRVEGNDLSTLQNSDVVTVLAGTDFTALGVSEDDILEIYEGPLAGQYVIAASPLSPTSLQLNVTLRDTASGLRYRIYRPNGEALSPPFVRITGVELLDSSGQPLGTTIPYARPVDVQTRAFQNPARGVKHSFVDATLGLVSRAALGGTFSIGSTALTVWVEGATTPQQTLNLTTTGPAVPLATVVAELNAEFLLKYGLPQVVTTVGSDRFGIRPVGEGGFVAVVAGSARTALFGDTQLRTTGDIRSDSVALSDWEALLPRIDMSSGLDVFQVLDGSDIGFYPAPFTTFYSNAAWPSALPNKALLVGVLDTSNYLPSKVFAPAKQRQVQVGARSLGSARVYFLEPTSFEVDSLTSFSLDLGEQGTVRFLPDPTLEHQKLPSLPSDTPIKDGSSADNSTSFTSASQDFILSGIRAGDRLQITTHPIEGTVVLPDPVPALSGSTLVFSLAGTADRTAIFQRDDASLAVGEVSRQGVIDQINAAAGDTIAELTGDNRIRFSTHESLVIRGTGSSPSPANAVILGSVSDTGGVRVFGVEDQNNASPHAGSYRIESVTQNTLVLATAVPMAVDNDFSSPVAEQCFYVYRVGVQRVSSTQMAENVAEAGLYYFDVELVSEGAGDLWNVDAGQQLVPTGYRSDGYYLTTDDSNLTFSEAEKPRLVLSRSILESGVDDDPSNATQLTGENIEITYERSQLISDVQNFISSETERVICANPLSRHLIPYFVRFDVSYTGGAREDLVVTDLTAYVEDLAPVDTLDSSDVQKTVTDLGASYVRNPLELIAVVHNVDRSVWVERSQDQLALDNRLSAFIPERIVVTREVT
jgi:hypothetical protein